MTRYTDPDYLQKQQYQDDRNLRARIELHERFSTNPYEWQRWVFDQITLPTMAQVLELGAGPADLWAKNLDRIPAGWQITISDFSPGMVAQAEKRLFGGEHLFSFRQINAQDIPFADATFDAVIANHMLYHVPDRAAALCEIQRLLKPGGRLYAATNGKAHMIELRDLITAFAGDADDPWKQGDPVTFNLETGGEELEGWFEHVSLSLYEDELVVTEVEPLVAYIRSMLVTYDWPQERLQALAAHAAAQISDQGAIRISKSTCLFVGQRAHNRLH